MCSEKEVREAFPAEVDATHPRIVTRADVDAIFSDESVITRAREKLVRHRVTTDQMGLLREGLTLFEGTQCFRVPTMSVRIGTSSRKREWQWHQWA